MKKKNIELKLIEIKKNIDENCHLINEIGLLSGLSGLALFYYHYNKYFNIIDKNNDAFNCLSRSVDIINEGDFQFSYCYGVAGLGWVFEYLHRDNFFLESYGDTLLSNLDGFLKDNMDYNLDNKNIDLLHGAIGYGLFFLKRYSGTKNRKLKHRYKLYLIELIQKINLMGEFENTDIVKFKSVNPVTFKEGYNLSLAHGNSSVINFYSRLYKFRVFRSLVEDVLKQNVNFIISSYSPEANSTSLFPDLIDLNGVRNNNTRLAWCYGDLGVAISLWHASSVLKNPVLKNFSLDIFKHAAKRRVFENTYITDSGLCHGAFGVFQIFKFIYSKTNNEIFKEAADFWFKEGFERAIFDDGFAGFKTWNGAKKVWVNEISLLEGISGIGLALISLLSEEKINWDECLLIN
ncbi:lanthionine synthetase C family protein [Flavobacterium sp. PL02]|uniref:lanthionine synthetase C family protein n=1 Tax=Flavobacterium sp. PL02 TaxID=3088354 RepID=UPI00057F6DD1|nr:lanthionine synthetase C family protein [Flavobacterium sp. PL02]KIC01666.1 hypothetical protein OA88_12820 [Flavobacterium sp. JRM]MEA9413561.1 lanthionine synthetase C family protein [Flavobacterium sp. PL02]